MAFQGTTAAGTSAGDADGTFQFSFSDLVRVAAARATLILGVATLIVVLTIVALLLWPTTYSAATVVMLEQRTNNVAQTSEVLSAQPSDPASVQNQIQILTSRDIAAQVIANLRLYEDPEFASPNMITGAMPTADQMIDGFLRRLTVEANGLSTSLTITFKSGDPQKAAQIANAIADAYLQDQVNVENQAARSTTDWLIARVHTLARQVQNAESAVQEYKATNGLNDTGDGTSLVDQQMIGVSAALVAAKSDLAQKQATSGHINAMLQSGQVDGVSQVVASPLIVQLRTQEADILQKEAELSTRYGPRNPKIIDIESQKENLEAKVAQEAQRIGGSVANDVSVSRANVGSLQYSLDQLEKKSTSQGLTRVRLRALEANATSTRTMYEAFVTRLREAQGGIEFPDARIISHASAPASPTSPKRTMIAAASVPAGLLIGLLCALIAERVSPAMQYRPVPVRAPVYAAQPAPDPLRGAPVLGDIPDYAALRAADLVIDRPAEDYARAVDALLAQIVPQMRGRGKVISLTAPDYNEGRTALATALARAATQRGFRAIVIDGDFQFPRAAIAMGLPPLQHGLQDVLSGTAPLSQSLSRDPRSSALLLSPTAMQAPNASFLNALPQLVTYLRQTFDLVIVDCPQPTQPNAARYFLPLSDAALLLVRWQATPRASVSRTLDTLAAMRVPAAGIVFAR
ncbi:MAG TPA: exopolysaccharide transport family protein [Rhizomicrobium sp.]